MVDDEERPEEPTPPEDSSELTTLMLDVLSETESEPVVLRLAVAAPETEPIQLGRSARPGTRDRRIPELEDSEAFHAFSPTAYTETVIARDAEQGAAGYIEKLRHMQALDGEQPRARPKFVWLIVAVALAVGVATWFLTGL